jgi:hypothetical protein
MIDLQKHSAQFPLWKIMARDNTATQGSANSSTRTFSGTAECNNPDDTEVD